MIQMTGLYVLLLLPAHVHLASLVATYMVIFAQPVGSTVCIPIGPWNARNTSGSVKGTRRIWNCYWRARTLNALFVWRGCTQSSRWPRESLGWCLGVIILSALGVYEAGEVDLMHQEWILILLCALAQSAECRHTMWFLVSFGTPHLKRRRISSMGTRISSGLLFGPTLLFNVRYGVAQ